MKKDEILSKSRADNARHLDEREEAIALYSYKVAYRVGDIVFAILFIADFFIDGTINLATFAIMSAIGGTQIFVERFKLGLRNYELLPGIFLLALAAIFFISEIILGWPQN